VVLARALFAVELGQSLSCAGHFVLVPAVYAATVHAPPANRSDYSILTFRGPCIMIYSYGETNEMH